MKPTPPVSSFFSGIAYLEQNRIADAEAEIEKGLALSPKNQLGQNLKSLLLFKKNRREEALERLSKFPLVEDPSIQGLFLFEFEKLLS